MTGITPLLKRIPFNTSTPVHQMHPQTLLTFKTFLNSNLRSILFHTSETSSGYLQGSLSIQSRKMKHLSDIYSGPEEQSSSCSLIR